MARFGFLISLSIPLALIVGCQAPQQVGTPLPEPNFAGPVVEQVASQREVIPPPKVPEKVTVVRDPSVPAAWTPLASAEKREWNWIVIHHSATPTGGAKAFDKAHKAKGWDELGYHFVIGNGSDTADGLVEVGSRWPVQKHGAHAKTPNNEYNEHGIGICLVGNFDVSTPSPKQLQSLAKLVAFLADKYHIKQSDIIGHKMTGKQTDCPGNNTNINQIRQMVAKLRTQVAVEDAPVQPDTELMQSASR